MEKKLKVAVIKDAPVIFDLQETMKKTIALTKVDFKVKEK